MKKIPSPHFNERKTKVSMLVLHSNVFNAVDGIKKLEENKVSAHYFIDYNGDIFQTVDEDKRAWHAGIGQWRDITDDINSHSIGIEVCSPSLGQEPLNKKQTTSLINLCSQIIKRHKIKAYNVIGHSDIAPSRKPDPGLAFPWKKLAKNGIGLWHDLRKKSHETDIKKMLNGIGYTHDTDFAAYAFCCHFAPQLIDQKKIKTAAKNVVHGKLSCQDFDQEVIENLKNDIKKLSPQIIRSELFLKTLQAVFYEYERRSKKP